MKISNIEGYMERVIDLGGSDLHLKVGSTPMIRVNGKLVPQGERMSLEEIDTLITPLINEKVGEELKNHLGCDFSYQYKDIARFRMNLSYQKGSYMLVARVIPKEILDLHKLELPSVLLQIIKEKNGLLLVTGATGSGKSTTVASMLNEINKTQGKNIITIEDPIEFVYKDEMSIVAQKELGVDVTDFNRGLKFALRQDPDIIFIGELRDRETVEAALKASETGHLVVSTLHTVNAYQTIARILDLFPEERHKQLRYQLSENIRGIISQRLLPTVDGKRVAACEILRNTPVIKEAFLTPEGSIDIPRYIAEGFENYGTQTFDQDIIKKLSAGKISYEVALSYATVKKDVELARRGIGSTSSEDMYSALYED